MIPSSNEVLAGYRFWAWRWEMPLDVTALREARDLAGDDEAAETHGASA